MQNLILMKKFFAGKPVGFILGILLILTGLALPIATASFYIRFSGSFWLGLLFVCLSLFQTAIILTFARYIIIQAYPNIGSNINNFARKIGEAIASFLFRLGFAGKKSIWQKNKELKAGFFSGVWHGVIFPVSLGASLLSSNIQLYEENNMGFLYNYGFFLGIYVTFRTLFMPI